MSGGKLRVMLAALACLCVLVPMLLVGVVVVRGISEFDAQMQSRLVASGRAGQPWTCVHCARPPLLNRAASAAAAALTDKPKSQSCEGCTKGRHVMAQNLREQSLSLAAVYACQVLPREWRARGEGFALRALQLVAEHYASVMQLTYGAIMLIFARWLLLRLLAPAWRGWRQSVEQARLTRVSRLAMHRFARKMSDAPDSPVRTQDDSTAMLPPRPPRDYYASSVLSNDAGLGEQAHELRMRRGSGV